MPNTLPIDQEHLFSPMDAEVTQWSANADGYNKGCIEIYLTARDMAKFGSLFQNDGQWHGSQII